MYSDDFNDSGSGWPTTENEKVRYEYINDEYRILVKTIQTAAFIGPAIQLSYYVVMVDARNATGDIGAYGLIFEVSEDFSQFYFFEVRPDHAYAIYRVEPGIRIILASGTIDSIHPVTATNQLKIERNGSQIWAYANGDLLNIINDATYTGTSYIGLIAVSYAEPNVDIRFNNYAIYPIDCGSSSAPASISGELPAVKIVDSVSVKNFESHHNLKLAP